MRVGSASCALGFDAVGFAAQKPTGAVAAAWRRLGWRFVCGGPSAPVRSSLAAGCATVSSEFRLAFGGFASGGSSVGLAASNTANNSFKPTPLRGAA